MLSIVVMAIAMFSIDSSCLNIVLAQSGNNLGLDGDDDNDTSQPETSSQEANHHSMCVSGDITSLSCNNLSSESIGDYALGPKGPTGEKGDRGPQGPAGPQSLVGKIYTAEQVTDDTSPFEAFSQCDPGDYAISGVTYYRYLGDTVAPLAFLQTGQSSLDSWGIAATPLMEDDFEVFAMAYCFDNP